MPSSLEKAAFKQGSQRAGAVSGFPGHLEMLKSVFPTAVPFIPPNRGFVQEMLIRFLQEQMLSKSKAALDLHQQPK